MDICDTNSPFIDHAHVFKILNINSNGNIYFDCPVHGYMEQYFGIEGCFEKILSM